MSLGGRLDLGKFLRKSLKLKDLGKVAPPGKPGKSSPILKKVQNKKRSKKIKEPIDIEPIYIIIRM